MRKILELINKLLSSIFKKDNLEQKNINEDKTQSALDDNKQTELKGNKIYIQNINYEIIKQYDIVLVKMNEKDVWYSQHDHFYRPFLIKTNNSAEKTIDGYYFTSNLNNEYFTRPDKQNIKIVLQKDNYNLSKNSVVLFQREIKIPYEQVIHYIDHLTVNDQERLERSLLILQNHRVKLEVPGKKVKVGDIVITDRETYIIYSVDNVHIYGYLIKDSTAKVIQKDDFNLINIGKKIYYIDFEKQKIFDTNNMMVVVGAIDDKKVDVIKNNKKEIKYRQKNRQKKR